MKTRIYIVGQDQSIRLIRATTRLQALDHATKGIVNISAITKDELQQHMIRGTKIEDATGGKQEEVK